LQITLIVSINGMSCDEAQKRQYTYQSEVVSQMICDVNQRMQNFSIHGDSAFMLK